MNAESKATLPRVLGPTAAISVIVGSVIGSGIFIVPGRVAHEVPWMGGIAFVWVVGGLFSLAGALTVAELGAMLPRAGGPYVYIREAYGLMPAFLFGWTEFLVVRTGAMATLAAAFALYFTQIVPPPSSIMPEFWQMSAAVTSIVLLTVVNVAGTRLGGSVQVVGTALKVGALSTMIVLPFLLGQAHVSNLTPVWPTTFSSGLIHGIMAAMVGVLWTYDGWIHATALAEEIEEPERNLPWSLALGSAILIALYLGMTLIYHMVLTLPEVAASATEKGSPRVVAAEFCRHLLGQRGVVGISLVVMCSTFISINGNCLAGPRTYFAMARDGVFFPQLARVHPRFQTPANAVVVQGLWAILLTLAGTGLILLPPPATNGVPGPIMAAWTKLHSTPLYDVLYTYVIFGATFFYLLVIASVFVLRVRRPELPRPYRVWGYPFTPLLFVVAALLLMGSMLVQTPYESISGLALILLGIPAYWVFASLPDKAAGS
jgi:basic amino acid/polyamine antiporter, APA family